ncbi:MAG: nucleotidyltransferase family protein, partial [Firmicutes bacterium]|nr:nucleotidyltransferase family protein [Candidatus Colimorpha enterica]
MIDETVKTALYLLSNVINGRTADKSRLADCDLRALLEFAVSSSISSALCIALEDAGALSGSPYEGKWMQEKFRAVRKRMLMDGETAAVENAFRASGIRYMVMKGGTLCRYYPKPEMREMADCDVLIGERDYDRAAEIMRSLGYEHDSSDERADQREYS